MICKLAWLTLAMSNTTLAKPIPEALDGWQGSRWHIEMEQTLPVPVELAATLNRSFRTRALQVRAVLTCPEMEAFGKRNAALTCRFEELSIKATPRSLQQAPAVYTENAKVVALVEMRLKEQPIEVVLGSDGRIVSVDVPDLEWRNRRESENREVLRRIVYDIVAPWHLKHDEEWRAGFVERNSILMRAPGQPAASGRSKAEHAVSDVDGQTVVQSSAKGSFTTPYEPWENSFSGLFVEQGSGGATGSRAGSTANANAGGGPTASTERPVGLGTAPRASTPTDYTFTGELTSVAVVNPNGRVTERVWAMLGSPTASSLGNMQGSSVWYAGHARELTDVERPSVGTSGIVAPPGAKTEALPAWVPLQTF